MGSAVSRGISLFGIWIALQSICFAQTLSSAEPIPPLPALNDQLPPAPTSAVESLRHHPLSKMFLGSASCSSVACHGNTRRETVWGSASQFFYDRDRHQFAGEVLRGPRSLEIAKRLGLTVPWKAHECLTCHAPAAVGDSNPQDFAAKLNDGVGCENCHGAARQWISSHRSFDWKLPEAWSTEQKTQIGFRNTKSIAARADLCADCHVGNATQAVTHDLIAAGHPRLTFEYSAYESMMPLHWRRSADRYQTRSTEDGIASDRSTLEATIWLIGQLTNARHELTMLKSAIERQGDTLAHYDCYACHHGLSSASTWRQTRNISKQGRGQVPFGTWNLGFSAEIQTALPTVVSNTLPMHKAQLVEEMQKRTIQRDDAASKTNLLDLIESLQTELAESVSHAVKYPLSSADLRRIRDTLEHETMGLSDQGWDRSAQLFLAISALEIGIADSSGRGRGLDRDQATVFEQLRKLLAFDHSQQSNADRTRESPRFDKKRMTIRQQFELLQSIHN